MKGRRCLASALCVIYFLRGVHGFEQRALENLFRPGLPAGLRRLPFTRPWMRKGNRLPGRDRQNKSSPAGKKCFHNIATKGALAPACGMPVLLEKRVVAARAYTSSKALIKAMCWWRAMPPAYVEVEIAGRSWPAACRAAKAMADELDGGRLCQYSVVATVL